MVPARPLSSPAMRLFRNPKNRVRVILSLAKDLFFFRTCVKSGVGVPKLRTKSRFFVAPLLRMTLRHSLDAGRSKEGIERLEQLERSLR
jgi:hypothetical protein